MAYGGAPQTCYKDFGKKIINLWFIITIDISNFESISVTRKCEIGISW